MDLRHLLLLAKRVGFLLILYTFCRLLFYVFNYSFFTTASFWNILAAFIHGWRFDLSILCWANVLFIVLSILPFSFLGNKVYQIILKVLFLVVNIPLLILNLIDIELFKFRGKRSTYQIIGMLDDIKDQSIQLLFNYWYLSIILGLLIFILIKLYPKDNKKTGLQVSKPIAIPTFILLIGILILGMRGGLQLKPVRPNSAFILHPNVLGNISLNTPFSFFMTMDIKGIEKVNYFNSDLKAYQQIERPQSFHFSGAKKENVVIIILESFAAEYWGKGNNYKGYTPFLDSLSGHGIFIKTNFANGRTSMDAVPAILAGIPALMDESYITSIYQTNKLIGLGNIVHKYGYHTSFFHGARNGTMGFDVFVKNAGFRKYYGLNEYPDQGDFDGHWGIYDEPFLQFFCKEISTFEQPFLTSVFTISSHQPYSLPAKYKNKFPKGDLEIHKTIGYVDHALRKFFESAKKEKWYDNTLFIITADHTQMNLEKEYANIVGMFNVPLVIFHPSKKLPSVRPDKVTQHADIMPTVLDYLDMKDEPTLPFGASVFDTSQGLALNYLFNSYRIMKPEYFLDNNLNKGTTLLFDIKEDKEEKNPITDKPVIKKEMENQLKAYIQFYNNGLNENNWYNYTTSSNGGMSGKK